jgi:O-antigen/teichoic acid export membrane protein
MAYLVVAGSMLINVLGQAAIPRLARAASNGDPRGFIDLMGKMLLVSFSFGLATIIVSSVFHQEIMRTLYGDRFGVDSGLLVWVTCSGLLVYVTSCLGFGLTALRVFRVAPLICLLACGVNLALCWSLTPSHGLRGVVLAWAASLLVHGLLNVLANAWGLCHPQRAQADSQATLNDSWQAMRSGMASPPLAAAMKDLIRQGLASCGLGDPASVPASRAYRKSKTSAYRTPRDSISTC